jgi:hypothetical protein
LDTPPPPTILIKKIKKKRLFWYEFKTLPVRAGNMTVIQIVHVIEDRWQYMKKWKFYLEKLTADGR